MLLARCQSVLVEVFSRRVRSQRMKFKKRVR